MSAEDVKMTSRPLDQINALWYDLEKRSLFLYDEIPSLFENSKVDRYNINFDFFQESQALKLQNRGSFQFQRELTTRSNSSRRHTLHLHTNPIPSPSNQKPVPKREKQEEVQNSDLEKKNLHPPPPPKATRTSPEDARIKSNPVPGST